MRNALCIAWMDARRILIRSITGEPASAGAVARHYRGLLTGIVVENGDEDGDFEGCVVRGASTWMRTIPDRVELAKVVLSFAESLA